MAGRSSVRSHTRAGEVEKKNNENQEKEGEG